MKASDLGFEPLHDAAGRAYPPEDLPCYWLPQMWDDDAPGPDKRHARTLCRTECPALTACRRRRRELQTRADGVWAGVIIRRRTTTTPPEDPVVRQWREEFNISTSSKGTRRT